METEQAEITLEDLRKGSDNLLRRVYEENRDKFLNFAKIPACSWESAGVDDSLELAFA